MSTLAWGHTTPRRDSLRPARGILPAAVRTRPVTESVTPQRVLHVGADQVVLETDHLLVISRANMDGWDVRRHRHTVIRFDGRTWRVVSKVAFSAGTIRYELVPWTPLEQEPAGREIDYSPDYVLRRDRTLAGKQHRDRTGALLRLCSPLVGFLSARIKGHLEEHYGIDSVASSWHSVIVEAIVGFCSLAVAGIGLISGGFNGFVFLAPAIVILADALVRWDRILWEERPPPGFYEWIVARPRSGP